MMLGQFVENGRDDDLLSQINKSKIIPILRGVELEDAIFIIDCFVEAKYDVLEISLNQPNSLDTLEKLNHKFGKHMTIGAGTVLTKDIAMDASNAGATFFLSPNVSKEVAEIAVEKNIPYIPGALTPTEIHYANELGAELIKVFPVKQLGASYIKVVLAALNKVNLLAVGGIGTENIGEFFQAGVKGVGVGNSLFEHEYIKSRNKKQVIK